MQPFDYWGSKPTCNGDACVEQVHVALGGPGELVVLFVTADPVVTEVSVWERGDESTRRVVSGEASVHSMLMYLQSWQASPPMGDKAIGHHIVEQLEDTSSWAFDPFTGARSGAYFSTKEKHEIVWGLGRTENMQMTYDSPVVHTVRLQGLTPGAAYVYRAARDPRHFEFVMPLEPTSAGPYPFTFGLTADLGQTAVSDANVHKLVACMERSGPGRGAVLLAGDLSYADGLGPRWDSFGRMMEPLASRFAVLAVGGNHEAGMAENWVPYNTRCAPRDSARGNRPGRQRGDRPVWWPPCGRRVAAVWPPRGRRVAAAWPHAPSDVARGTVHRKRAPWRLRTGADCAPALPPPVAPRRPVAVPLVALAHEHVVVSRRRPRPRGGHLDVLELLRGLAAAPLAARRPARRRSRQDAVAHRHAAHAVVGATPPG